MKHLFSQIALIVSITTPVAARAQSAPALYSTQPNLPMPSSRSNKGKIFSPIP